MPRTHKMSIFLSPDEKKLWDAVRYPDLPHGMCARIFLMERVRQLTKPRTTKKEKAR